MLDYIQTGNFSAKWRSWAANRIRRWQRSGTTVLGAVKEETFQHILELAPSRLHMNFLR